MNRRGKDGKTLRETLAVVKRFTGKMPEEGINPEELPDILEHVWGWFLILNSERQIGMGPSPLSSPQMLAFFQLECVTPEPWEVSTIRALDRVALKSSEEKATDDNA